MFAKTMDIASFDPELAKAIKGERQRQEDHVELIASENYASPRVLEAQGSVLTNKYAEGYPGKRYYGGCEYVDVAEQLAIDRAKKLFGADYANVQPHSGSQANAAAYFALVQPGDAILGQQPCQPEPGHRRQPVGPGGLVGGDVEVPGGPVVIRQPRRRLGPVEQPVHPPGNGVRGAALGGHGDAGSGRPAAAGGRGDAGCGRGGCTGALGRTVPALRGSARGVEQVGQFGADPDELLDVAGGQVDRLGLTVVDQPGRQAGGVQAVVGQVHQVDGQLCQPVGLLRGIQSVTASPNL